MILLLSGNNLVKSFGFARVVAFVNNREVENRVYSKRQTCDSRLCFLEKTSTQTRIVQNNSGFWCQRKTTQFLLENENSEPQMWDKHGHVVISAVCRKRTS